MSTLREQLLSQVLVQLNTSTPAGVPLAERSRGDDIPPATATAISVRPIREVTSRAGGPGSAVVHRKLLLAVECWAAAGTGQAVDQVLDPLLEWVTKALGGSTLGGKAHVALEDDIQPDAELRDGPYGKATVFVTVSYQTAPGPPPDTTAPGQVTDLFADLPIISGGNAITDLSWTAAGDDGVSGTAAKVHLRYSTAGAITGASWAAASVIWNGIPNSVPGGTATGMTATVPAGSRTWFAVRYEDEAGNLGATSNSPFIL